MIYGFEYKNMDYGPLFKYKNPPPRYFTYTLILTLYNETEIKQNLLKEL